MLLKSEKVSLFPQYLVRNLKAFFRIVFYTSLLIFLAASAIAFIRLISLEDGHRVPFIKNTVKSVISTFYVLKYLPKEICFTLKTYPKSLEVLITDKDYSQLNYLRSEAIKKGKLDEVGRQKFNVKIVNDNELIDARIRLKGEITANHLDQQKWSMRVDLSDQTIDGATSFSLQHPIRRSLITSKILRVIASSLDMPISKMSLIELSINSNTHGIYQLEEIWNLHAAERENGSAGVILSFDESAHMAEGIDTKRALDNAYYTSQIIVSQEKTVVSDRRLMTLATSGAELLSSFRNGNSAASEVFDQEHTGKWLALGDLLGTWHGYSWGNLKFIYAEGNPRLRPLFWDMADENHLSTPSNRFSERLIRLTDTYMDPNSPFWDKLLTDQKILRSYLKYLDFLTTPRNLEKLYPLVVEETREYRDTLAIDYPQISLQDEWKRIEKNAAHIREAILENPSPVVGSLLTSEGTLVLQVANRMPFPIKVIGLKTINGRLFEGVVGENKILSYAPAGHTPVVETFKLRDHFGKELIENQTDISALVVQRIGAKTKTNVKLGKMALHF